ncbi:DUF5677 domain-containing protein [Variovorax sp. RB2P76]|uniref:DUF5677 domain-containing protein n=1 Tax=Variovorax sp. RB2P76 TaxID=3443736 RepID=UPI003F46B863
MDYDPTPDAVALADRTCRLTDRVLRIQRTDLADRTRVVMLAHALRMLRFVQGAVSLAGVGNLEPACVLARTVLEMGWVMASIQADPTRMDKWLEQANGEAIKSIRRLKQLGEDERLPTLSDAHIDAAIAGLPAGKSFNLKDWADASGARQAYPTIYQQLSACAHAEMPATVAYTRWDEATGIPTSVQDADLEELPADSLNVCTALLLDALRYLAGPTLSPDELRELEMVEELRRAQTARLDRIRMKHIEPRSAP